MSNNSSVEVYNLTYVSLDSAIDTLFKLRNEHGGDAILDIEMVPVPYSDGGEELYISVTPRK